MTLTRPDEAVREPGPADRPDCVLVVDVDGTLIRGDLFLEGMLSLCVSRPRRVFALVAAIARGRASAKAFVASEISFSPTAVVFEPVVVELIRVAQAAGRPVVLASGAHHTHVAALGDLLGASAAWGSNQGVSLTGKRKLQLIQSTYEQFDYVGNGHADLPLWGAANRAIAVNASSMVLRRALRVRPDLVMLGARFRWSHWLRSLRPHQWAKNLLLLLPGLAAHLQWTAVLALQMVQGFVAFSAVASAVYLLNDLVDLPNDRRHAHKRFRPLAAGQIGIALTVGTLVALLAAGALLASALPVRFQALLAVYLVVSTAYSFELKRRTMADVITLTTLYTLRLLAGAVLAVVSLSQWFLAFSVFFFFSLALLKRVAELRGQPELAVGPIAGRPYGTIDIPTLTAFGAAASGASSLVYCLYITSEGVGRLYTHPDLLWLGLLLVIYWQTRMWLIGGRGRMNEDPVLFTLRDRMSRLVLAAFLFTAWLAA